MCVGVCVPGQQRLHPCDPAACSISSQEMCVCVCVDVFMKGGGGGGCETMTDTHHI